MLRVSPVTALRTATRPGRQRPTGPAHIRHHLPAQSVGAWCFAAGGATRRCQTERPTSPVRPHCALRVSPPIGVVCFFGHILAYTHPQGDIPLPLGSSWMPGLPLRKGAKRRLRPGIYASSLCSCSCNQKRACRNNTAERRDCTARCATQGSHQTCATVPSCLRDEARTPVLGLLGLLFAADPCSRGSGPRAAQGCCGRSSIDEWTHTERSD
jgi:hypothetical protein